MAGHCREYNGILDNGTPALIPVIVSASRFRRRGQINFISIPRRNLTNIFCWLFWKFYKTNYFTECKLYTAVKPRELVIDKYSRNCIGGLNMQQYCFDWSPQFFPAAHSICI